MDDNSLIMKVFNYSWILLALLPFFGGLGFIFAGWRVDETRWMDEGIIYMIPFIFISVAIYDIHLVYLAIIIWFVGIIRAIMILRPYNKKLTEKQYEKNNQLLIYESNQLMNNQNHEHVNTQIENGNNNNISPKKDFNKLNLKHSENKEEKKGRKLDL